jgi:hypothetical protein
MDLWLWIVLAAIALLVVAALLALRASGARRSRRRQVEARARSAEAGRLEEIAVHSEEEVVTGTTEMRPRERVRLRKVLVTEQVTKTVPVRREEIRLETDPPPEGRIERVEEVE